MSAAARARDGVPRAPWGAFPLSELTVVAAFALTALGVVFWGTARGVWLAGAGVALGCLAGLELCVREHFAGYRSHSTLLAGTAAIAVSVPSSLAHLSPAAVGVICVAAFVASLLVLPRAFRRRRGRGSYERM